MKGERAALIAARLKKAKGMVTSPSPAFDDSRDQTVEDSDESGYDMGLDSAAESVISAVKSGDASALKSALKSFVRMCGLSSDEGEGDE